MSKYVCSRCYKEFKRKAHYDYHVNRKRPCHEVMKKINEINNENNELKDNINEDALNSTQDVQNCTQLHPKEQNHRCKYCKNTFTRNSSLTRHYKTCKRKKEIDAENKVIYEAILQKMIEYEAKMEKFMEQNQQLAQENKMLKSTIITNTNSHNTTNIENSNVNTGTVNNVNIHINALGNENTDYLTNKDKMEILEKMHKSIITYVEKVHFNPDHPENHNVYVQNLKNSYGAMFNGDRWETRHISDIVESLMDYGRNKIEEIREEMKEKGKVRNYVEGRLDELFNAIDGDDSEKSKNIMKVSEERIRFLAFDKRDVVKDTMDTWMENNRKNRKKKKIAI